MTTRAFRAAGWLAAVVVTAGAVPSGRAQPIPTNLVPGNFTFQFANTSGTPITTLNVPVGTNTATVRLYLIQTGGTPPNVLQQLGAETLGVRLNYSGGIAQVTTPAAITGPLDSFGSPEFDFVQRGGTSAATTTAQLNDPTLTTTTAFISETIIGNPVVVADASDPLRLLMGTFRFSGITGGTMVVQAVDPFTNTNNLTGPNPPTLPPSGTNGEINIDPLLAQNVSSALIPTLTITVPPVPEPGTFALGGLAVAGLAVLRRRRQAAAAATAA